jgi:hypothetical protein
VRISENKDDRNVEEVSKTLDGKIDLMVTASKIFSAIGYPAKPSLFNRLAENITDIKTSDLQLKFKSCERTTSRIIEAFELLFEILSESNGFAAIDEVHDLIRNDRLASVGGRLIFQHLTQLIVEHAVNSATMKIAFAGSSNFLWFDLNKTVLIGTRSNMQHIEDMQADVIIKYLVEEHNIPIDIAANIIEKCGTRLRLVLKCATAEDWKRQLDELYSDALENLNVFYASIKEYHELHATLTKISKGEIITLFNIPKDQWHVEKFSQIIYVGRGARLYFQNRIVEEMWKEHFQNITL